MKISIFGLGYVGGVTAACLARDGHQVIGVDVNPEKVDLIAKGESPTVELGLSQLLVDGVAANLITATTDTQAAVLVSDVSLISVATPPVERVEPDLTHVWNVCKQIGKAASQKNGSHVVVLHSTVPQEH